MNICVSFIKAHPKHFRFLRSSDKNYFIDKLWGGSEYRKAIQANLSYDEFKSTWQKDSEHYEKLFKEYRLY